MAAPKAPVKQRNGVGDGVDSVPAASVLSLLVLLLEDLAFSIGALLSGYFGRVFTRCPLHF